MHAWRLCKVKRAPLISVDSVCERHLWFTKVDMYCTACAIEATHDDVVIIFIDLKPNPPAETGKTICFRAKYDDTKVDISWQAICFPGLDSVQSTFGDHKCLSQDAVSGDTKQESPCFMLVGHTERKSTPDSGGDRIRDEG